MTTLLERLRDWYYVCCLPSWYILKNCVGRTVIWWSVKLLTRKNIDILPCLHSSSAIRSWCHAIYNKKVIFDKKIHHSGSGECPLWKSVTNRSVICKRKSVFSTTKNSFVRSVKSDPFQYNEKTVGIGGSECSTTLADLLYIVL